MGGLLGGGGGGGGGGQRACWPPSQIIGGPGPLCHPPPSSYAYDSLFVSYLFVHILMKIYKESSCIAK